MERLCTHGNSIREIPQSLNQPGHQRGPAKALGSQEVQERKHSWTVHERPNGRERQLFNTPEAGWGRSLIGWESRAREACGEESKGCSGETPSRKVPGEPCRPQASIW